jgi:arabinan endo-1,5-alpha-L-arabinosidase
MWNLISNHIKIICSASVATLLLVATERIEAQMLWAYTNYSVAVTPQMAAFGSRGIHVHDPSAIVKCGDEYWIFSTGHGIPSYHSKDLITWERGPSVFTNAPDWVAMTVPRNRWMYYWAPDVIHLGDRFLLYYAVSVFGKRTSVIALATNPTLDPNDPRYHWADEGVVIQTGETNNFNAIDPAASLDMAGNLWLALGSYWTGIKLIQLDSKTGKRIAADSPMYSLAFNDSIEASYIYHHNGFYYLFVNWGQCCQGTNSTYEIRVGRSRDITGEYLDKDGEAMMAGGGTRFLASQGPFIGPGQIGIISLGGTNLLSCHFYDGTRRGISALAILPLKWDADGWPKVGWNQP